MYYVVSIFIVFKSNSFKDGFYPFSDAPIVSLRFGTSLNPSNIAEGNDVYFECEIDATPDVYKIVWLHNVSMPNSIFRVTSLQVCKILNMCHSLRKI